MWSSSATIAALFLCLDAVSGLCVSDSFCGLLDSDKPYCCRDGDCCSSLEYAAESAGAALSLSLGAIIGIVVGSIVLLIACIVGCVCCCCNQGRTTPGTVVTAAPQAVVVQQYPGGVAYPAGQGYASPGQAYPQQAAPGGYPTAAPPAYDTKMPGGPPHY